VGGHNGLALASANTAAWDDPWALATLAEEGMPAGNAAAAQKTKEEARRLWDHREGAANGHCTGRQERASNRHNNGRAALDRVRVRVRGASSDDSMATASVCTMHNGRRRARREEEGVVPRGDGGGGDGAGEEGTAEVTWTGGADRSQVEATDCGCDSTTAVHNHVAKEGAEAARNVEEAEAHPAAIMNLVAVAPTEKKETKNKNHEMKIPPVLVFFSHFSQFFNALAWTLSVWPS